jgi:hypothetical protein
VRNPITEATQPRTTTPAAIAANFGTAPEEIDNQRRGCSLIIRSTYIYSSKSAPRHHLCRFCATTELMAQTLIYLGNPLRALASDVNRTIQPESALSERRIKFQ